MFFTKFKIANFKSFQVEQELKLAQPVQAKTGSGITYLVGGNNSGKTTLIEGLSIKNGKNINTSERTQTGDPEFCLFENDTLVRKCTLIRPESSTIKEEPVLPAASLFEIISSRRHWNSQAGQQFQQVGQSLHTSQNFDSNRQSSIEVASELRTIEANEQKYQEFVKLVQRVIPEFTKFAVAYENSHYIEYISSNGTRHKTELLGDGVITAIRILVQLFANKENALIIDEPELSLHPSAQRKLLQLLGEYSEKRQIIISTHSPYMMSWEFFKNGAVINRVAKENDTFSKIYSVTEYSKYSNLMNGGNWQMPFAMDEVAKELFFMSDGILFLEGQEDVGLLRNEEVLKDVNIFGYGVRGKDNFKFAYSLSKDLGYKKVGCILDAGESETAIKNDLAQSFPEYKTLQWNKEDIRDKEVYNIKAKQGYFNNRGVKKGLGELDDFGERIDEMKMYLIA